MNGYEDTECEKYFTPPDKPSTANREASVTSILEYYFAEQLGKGAADDIADQILSLWPKVLSDEEIQNLLKELRRNSGGKILMAADIYRAISQATIDRRF